ncbi:hypothetical protein FHL15_004808 [Xylaria flabelliformis]|uniref:SnoaL-like domain-containing protein n=1 Tax=Xylaria flabelliformis TaxID=2512241 RepID=A0A553I2B7_9PEZI|nr:hypothetical protein FHL15_004808 [Xylaria flabelliformis]
MIISWAKQLLRTCLNKDTVTNDRDKDEEEEDGPVAIWLKDPRKLLIYLYQDLTRVSHVVSQDFVLHTFHDPSNPLEGIPAAKAHMGSLLASKVIVTVGSVTINYNLGVVSGTLRVPSPKKKGRGLYATFCDVWRFDGEGRPCEHWECFGTDPQEWTNWLKKARRRR